MRDLLHHFLTPQESNNHRAKILHHKSLIFFITFLFLGQFLFSFLRSNFSSVLGTSFNISSQELLLLVNQKRQAQGLSALVLNNQLSSAAYAKANDMFSKNYWAHNSPDGLTPWVFVKDAGYSYIYAGENLARGFSTSQDVVNAWMASASHRDNILSGNYKDIGFAIVPGKLLNEDTVLVVEMFGTSSSPIAKIEIPKEKAQISAPLLEKKEIVQTPKKVYASSTFLPSTAKQSSLIESSFITRNIGVLIVSLFILALVLDMIIVERKKIVRLVGHNTDHILFLGGILIIILVFARGLVI